MIIYINSRRVTAFKLRVYSDDRMIYDDVLFSNPKGKIEVETKGVNKLYFQWDFCFDREQRKMMDENPQSPEWGMYAYDDKDIFNTSGCDYIYDHACPLPTKGIYIAEISNITEEIGCMHLMFRRSAMNSDMPLLYVMNREEKKILKVKYVKADNAEELLVHAKKIIFKRTMMKLVEIIIFLVAVYFLEVYNPKKYLIYPLIFLVCYIAQSQFRVLKYFKTFFGKVEQYPCFTEQKGNIEFCKE